MLIRGSWVGEPEKFHLGKLLENCEISTTHDPTLTLEENQRLGPSVQERTAWQYIGVTWETLVAFCLHQV